ncbi:MAG: phage major capsid protein [Lachnospirales bacterium]
MTPREKLIDLSNRRTAALEAANAAMEAGNTAEYDSAMANVTNLNAEIQRVQNLIAEQERIIDARTPSEGELRDVAEGRANDLRSGGEVTFAQDEVRRFIRNAVTLATETLAEPTGVDGTIRDAMGNVPGSIIDRVSVMDLTGMGSFLVPYSISDLTATGGKVKTNAGTARSAGADPSLAYAELRPYEVNVTQYIDRNISRLTPVAYYNYIQSMSMRAMRRKVAALIANGDGQSSPDMHGIKTAKNKAGSAICAGVDISAINENIMDDLFFAYGSDEACGENAYLFLNKLDLKAIGKLRNGDKNKIFKITRTSANEGVIDDSGSTTPYSILKDLTALSTTTAASGAATPTMIYGDPANYLLGLFGGFTIRIDQSYKAAERLDTILGDVLVGGNVVVDKGFVIANLPKSGG